MSSNTVLLRALWFSYEYHRIHSLDKSCGYLLTQDLSLSGCVGAMLLKFLKVILNIKKFYEIVLKSFWRLNKVSTVMLLKRWSLSQGHFFFFTRRAFFHWGGGAENMIHFFKLRNSWLLFTSSKFYLKMEQFLAYSKYPYHTQLKKTG